MRSLLAAFQFLTVIPVRAKLSESDFERAPLWFPLVGLLIAALVVLVDWAFSQLQFSPMLSSLVAIGALAALSGGLHLDGLADTADGFLSARPRERVLEVMRDSRIGTMGVLALFFVLALKVTALAELAAPERWRAIVLAPLAGRCVQVVAMGVLPYARKEGGQATVFLAGSRNTVAVWAGLCLLAAAVWLYGPVTGAVRFVVFVTVAALLSLWSVRRIGGFTGDTLGATSEIVEAAVLMCAVAG